MHTHTPLSSHLIPYISNHGQGLLTKTALDPKEIDYILGGTVIQEVRTANIAREAAMAAGRYLGR